MCCWRETSEFFPITNRQVVAVEPMDLASGTCHWFMFIYEIRVEFDSE